MAMKLRIDSEFGVTWSTSFEQNSGGIIFWARPKVVNVEDGEGNAYCELIDSESLETRGENYVLQKEELMRRHLTN